LRGILATGEPLPLARVATFDEASLIERRIGALGVRSLIISDQDLALDTSPAKRMRAFEFTDGALLGYAVGGMETLRIPWEDILLFVAGRHHLRQVEVEERPGRGPEGEMLEARELSADEALLDLYTAQRDGGWRIAAHGFHFSCLGQQKSLLAAENFKNLTDHLRERAWRAAYDDSYMRLRHALAQVWPPEQSTESRGWRRELPGRYSTEAVTTSDNERQFTRYSRLRHHLKLRQSGSNV
ncbi:MAG TPA: hypothetical protein VD966_08475, partial [Pyrinomonadaceae bacterium]|nr:hypothetical protein [Pyrinomonadaceae bacterium]